MHSTTFAAAGATERGGPSVVKTGCVSKRTGEVESLSLLCRNSQPREGSSRRNSDDVIRVGFGVSMMLGSGYTCVYI
jgi:hypothetical protein